MDILRPNVLEINGRCYRQLVWPSSQTDQPYRDKVEKMVDSVEEELAWEEDGVRQTEDGFCIALPIPDVFHKHINGKKGDTKRRLESDTGVKIKLPRIGQSGDVEITASTAQAVLSAKTRIEILIDSVRPTLPWTHFISIPLNTSNFVKQFELFKNQVTEFASEIKIRGFDTSLFQNPAKLHLTIGTLRLYNNKDEEKAVQVLQDCLLDVLKPCLSDQGSPLLMQFTGLEYMNDDPSEVDVLFAKVRAADKSGRLQKLVDDIYERFAASGLMHREYEHVKLHATLINSIKRHDDDLPELLVVKKRPRISFDARPIMQKFKDFDFGKVEFTEVHISKRHTFDTNGYYQSMTTASLV